MKGPAHESVEHVEDGEHHHHHHHHHHRRDDEAKQPSKDDAENTKRVSFHGWWSQERNPEILAGVSALERDANFHYTLELKHVDFATLDFGDAILDGLSRCHHLDLGMCLGSYLDVFVESGLRRLVGLQQLTYTGAVWNVRSFPPCSSLKEICLENCRFESLEVIRELADGLHQSFSSLEVIKLAHCGLSDEHLKLIVQGLPQSVKTVDLSGNYCRSDGAAALAGILLQTDRALTTLNLTNQHPGECGGNLDLSLLGLAIVSNTSLQQLDLSFNMLSIYDIQSLVASLAKNTTLHSINLMSNMLDDRAMRLIGKYLPRIRGLSSLNIAANRFGESGADSLLNGLRTNLYLCDLAMPRGFMASEQIDYYLSINNGGRRLLHESSVATPYPLALWQLVFDRVNRLYQKEKETRATVIFHLLQGPVLFGKRT
jgi:hypothetical protein